MKKLVCLLLSAIFIFAFVGCGNKNGDEKANAPKDEQPGTEEQAPTADALSIYNQGVANLSNGTQCVQSKCKMDITMNIAGQETKAPMDMDMKVASGDSMKMAIDVTTSVQDTAVKISFYCDGENFYMSNPLNKSTIKMPLDSQTKEQLKQQQNQGVFDLTGCKAKEQNVKDNGDGTQTVNFVIDGSTVSDEVKKGLESKMGEDDQTLGTMPQLNIEDIKGEAIMDSNKRITNLKMTYGMSAAGDQAEQNFKVSYDINCDYSYPSTLEINPPEGMDIANAVTQ